MFKHAKKGGFTLIELLVVIAIIGLLSSIVFASLSGARAKGRVAAAQGSMRDIITAAILCKDESQAIKLPTETNNGGDAAVCWVAAADGTPSAAASTIVTTKYRALPTGWLFCNDVTTENPATACGSNVSAATTPKIVAVGDSKVITCSDSGCETK